MRKSIVCKFLFVVVAVAAMTTGAFAIPNQPPAPFPGACGYMPYVAAPPYYWVGSNMSYSQCINTGLPELVAFAHSHCPDCVFTEATCRPAKWCAM